MSDFAAVLREYQFIFMRNRAHFINYALGSDFLLTAGEAYRSRETQAIHLANNRTLTLHSMHLVRLADDYNIFKRVNGNLYYFFAPQQPGENILQYDERIRCDLLQVKPLGDYWVSLYHMNRWGGDFDKDGNPLNGKFLDGGHFELYFPGAFG